MEHISANSARKRTHEYQKQIIIPQQTSHSFIISKIPSIAKAVNIGDIKNSIKFCAVRLSSIVFKIAKNAEPVLRH